MKKENQKDFTKLTHKSGISLIVLIVTIIVIIILAAIVILTISKNNPVESAKEAKFKEDVRSFQDDLALTISKEYTDKQGQRNTKINATGYSKDSNDEEEYNNSVYKYIPSFTKEYEGKLIIKNDELMYKENVSEKESKLLTDLGIKENVKTAAEKVAENPAEYYGQKITNYNANGIGDWKIFYADENNVYIIASDYIDVDKLPSPTSGGSKPANTNTSYPKAAPLSNVLAGYSGSANITNEKIKALNNDYFITKGYTSSYDNMKAVAYMLDTNIWSIFATDKAEYVVGGPTVEMLMKSYSKKYGVDYRAQASSSTGYQISRDGGANWEIAYDNMLNTSDSLYVLPSSNGAYSMWLASPSAGSSINVINVYCNGDVDNNGYSNDRIGFRPLVCLKSDVTLKAVEGGYEIQ